MHTLYLAVECPGGSKHIRDLRLHWRVKAAGPLAFRSHMCKCALFERLVLINFLKLLSIGFRILLGNTGCDAVIFSFPNRNLFLKREILAICSYALELQRAISWPRFQARAGESVPDLALRIRRKEHFMLEPFSGERL